ncbi:E3 ubiquitin-protein ligase AMFR, partial [Orchesella cincta]
LQPLVNLALCAVILISHTLQHLVFGTLRTSEEENVKEQFWNLIFYKIVFVFGVVNVQEVEDAVGWCFFVSVIGFLQLARQLCKERHNYLIMMNDMTKLGEARRHRILALLAFILVTSVSLFLAVFTWFMKSVTVEQKHDILDLRYIPSMSLFTPNDDQEAMGLMRYDFNIGLHSAIFMLSEIGLLVLQTLHALTVCIFEQLYFRHRVSKWNPVSIFTPCALEEYDEEDLYMCINHNINYRFEMVTLLFDLIHHCHLLLCCNLFLSMTSLIVSLQMRLRVRQIHAVLKRRQSFTWLNEHIDQYANVEVEESEQDDNCAICWDSLASQKSKILPCNHMFHTTCLRKWLLVSMHCPTCRMSLLSEEEVELRREREPRRNLYQRRPPAGIWGILETGQILLDLFGGWDPLPDEFPEGQTLASNVPVFSDFNVPDCPVQTQQEVVLEQPNQDGPVKKDSEETPSVQSNIKEKGVAI